MSCLFMHCKFQPICNTRLISLIKVNGDISVMGLSKKACKCLLQTMYSCYCTEEINCR